MKKYNFFLDIDDTLIPEGKKEISAENLAAIKKARSLGCKFFINTGRPYCTVTKDIFTDEYFDGICSGGDYIVYHGKPIYSHFMPKEDIRALLTALMSKGYKTNFNIGGLNRRYYIGEKLPHYREDIYIPISSAEDFDTVFKDEDLQKYVVAERLSPDSEVIKELERYFTTVVHPTYTEGFLHGHGKALLMKKVEEALSLPHESTVAIGDSLNDTDMMEYAAISVAMGNAPKAVKSICDLVTDTSEKNGVAKAILKLIDEP